MWFILVWIINWCIFMWVKLEIAFAEYHHHSNMYQVWYPNRSCGVCVWSVGLVTILRIMIVFRMVTIRWCLTFLGWRSSREGLTFWDGIHQRNCGCQAHLIFYFLMQRHSLTACNAAPPATPHHHQPWNACKIQMAARGPQNCRRDMEMDLPLSFWMLLSTFAKKVF